jgi:molybdopterin-guanine dinucleotide biosynthesis protein B
VKRLHIVGRKNHGKTTLILELIPELTRRGLRVGTIKHTRHVHELDTPESDSCRHRQAGAAPAAIVTGNLIGVYLPWQADGDCYARLAPLFDACDLVLVEGDLRASAPKLEVWRETVGTPCVAPTHLDVVAVVSDDRPDVVQPIWPRADLVGLADCILSLLGLG